MPRVEQGGLHATVHRIPCDATGCGVLKSCGSGAPLAHHVVRVTWRGLCGTGLALVALRLTHHMYEFLRYAVCGTLDVSRFPSGWRFVSSGWLSRRVFRASVQLRPGRRGARC